MALGVGVVSERRIAPFHRDGSFGYFVTHLHELRPITLFMLALGTGFAFWFALGAKPKDA